MATKDNVVLMTREQAIEEARRRWGATGDARVRFQFSSFFSPTITRPRVYRVGYWKKTKRPWLLNILCGNQWVTRGSSSRTYDIWNGIHLPASWEEAFQSAGIREARERWKRAEVKERLEELEAYGQALIQASEKNRD